MGVGAGGEGQMGKDGFLGGKKNRMNDMEAGKQELAGGVGGAGRDGPEQGGAVGVQAGCGSGP